MDVSNEELLKWGDRETREIVEEKDPKAHLRHLTWIQAGCPGDATEQKGDKGGKPRTSTWRERLKEFDREQAAELDLLMKPLRGKERP